MFIFLIFFNHPSLGFAFKKKLLEPQHTFDVHFWKCGSFQNNLNNFSNETRQKMNKSCWLIFEHTQLLGRPAENVGWENSFIPNNMFLTHGDLPSSYFLCTLLLLSLLLQPKVDITVITIVQWLVSPSLTKLVAVDSLVLPFSHSRTVHGFSFPTVIWSPLSLCGLIPSHSLYIIPTYCSHLPILCSRKF
jgi:hypothetical protein